MSSPSLLTPYSTVTSVSPQAVAFVSGKFPLHQGAVDPIYYQQPQMQIQRPLDPLSLGLQNTMQQLQIDPSMNPTSPGQPIQSPAHLNPLFVNNTSATNNKEKRNRRWSLAGRFFEKRKSITEPLHIPDSHAQSFAAAYNSDNANVVGLNSRNIEGGNSNPQQPLSGESSASGSHSGSRRSSIADIPKAFLSSFRRGSLASNSSSNSSGNNNAASAQHETGHENEDNDEHGLDSPTITILFSDGLRQATMATMKTPPRGLRSRAQTPPLRSILKKRPSPAPSTSNSTASGGSGSNGNGVPPSRHRRLSPRNVHPMAASDSNVDINLFAPTDHRATLVTRSPVPQPHLHHHQLQHHLLSPFWSSNSGHQAPLSSPKIWNSGIPASASLETRKPNINSTSVGSPRVPSKLGLQPITPDQRRMSQGAAIPPDFTPGMQANVYQDRGGERSQGSVIDTGLEGYDDRMMSSRSVQMQQYEQPMMMPYISPRAQDLSAQYYNDVGQDPYAQQMTQGPSMYHGSSAQQNSLYDDPMMAAQRSTEMMMMESAGGTSLEDEVDRGMFPTTGMSRKSLSFMDTIEIIPAHRKSEYNRRSDKNATFRILTPDMKTEIRDELNNYKMREMAVHVDSMGNTAFH